MRALFDTPPLPRDVADYQRNQIRVLAELTIVVSPSTTTVAAERHTVDLARGMLFVCLWLTALSTGLVKTSS